VSFGRNRESRNREAAGRRSWPEAVPRKICGRKRLVSKLSENRRGDQITSIQVGIEAAKACSSCRVAPAASSTST
jgi:hypothetical protein